MSQFAILDASGLLDRQDVEAMIAACRVQLREHLAPAWNREELPEVREVHAEKEIGPEEIPCYLLGSPGDTAGAFGAHLEDAGRPVCRVYVGSVLRACPGSVLWDPDGGPSVSSVLSHELLETEIDTDAGTWIETNDRDEAALEVSDPDNSATYPLKLRPGSDWIVGLANFTLPRFWDVTATGGRCDWLNHLAGPFQVAPNGYMIRRSPNGQTQLVFGSRPPPGWLLGMKFNSSARSVRRLQRRPRTP